MQSLLSISIIPSVYRLCIVIVSKESHAHFAACCSNGNLTAGLVLVAADAEKIRNVNAIKLLKLKAK